ESMAIVLTVDSPRCWATSSTSRLPWFLVSSALRIAGRWSSNCTSTTAPMTWVILPTALGVVAMVVLVTNSERLCAGDDLDQLLGDHRLARAVHAQLLLPDHLAGVAGGIIHRGHARALLGRGVLQERAERLHRNVARQQLGEDIDLVGLVFVRRAVLVLLRKDR